MFQIEQLGEMAPISL